MTKLDRLARSVPDALEILGGLSDRGVRFALGGSVYDWNDLSGLTSIPGSWLSRSWRVCHRSD